MFPIDTYDTYCTHPLCIQQNDLFFNYTHDNPHILQHDQYTEPIHARHLQSILRSEDNQGRFREKYEVMVEEKIKRSVEDVKLRILKFLERKFFTAYGEEMKSKMRVSESRDARSLLDSLKSGNVELVKQIIDYRKTDKEITFLNYLKLIQTKSMEEEILNSFTHLGDKVIDILDLAFDDPNMILNLQEEYMNEMKNKNATPDTCLRESKRKSNSAGDESVEEVEIVNSNKTKPICKLRQRTGAPRGRKPKQVKEKVQEKQSIDNSFTLQLTPSQQVQLINPNELIIHHCSNPLKTFSHILQSHKNITSFHVFASKFATKDNIKRLFKHFPIQEITFNCDHQFQDSILGEFNEQQLVRLRNLELKWGLEKFFNEYHLMRQFPDRSGNQMEKVISMKSWANRLNIANNQTIWIDNDKMAADLRFRSDQLRKLRVLHVASLEKVHLKHLDFPSMTNLTTLNLNSASFAGDNCFAKLINSNPHITTINIYNCPYLNSNNATETLEHLKSLRNLTNFSFMPRGELYLHAFVIAELVSLQNLHLSNVNFFHPKGYTDSSNLKDFSQLKHLKSLSLYACNPIHSDFLSYLDPKVLSTMTILNLGFTQVDNLCTQHLLKMQNLQYLNIDGLDFAGTIFLELCKLHRQTYNKPWKLKYLSVEENRLQREVAIDRFSLQTMKEIGPFLPSLQYIYIAHCKSLKDYNFEDFKALRTVALDKQLSLSFSKRSQHLNWHVFECPAIH